MKRLAFLAIAVVFVVMGPIASADDARVIERDFEAEPGDRLTLDIKSGSDATIIGWDKNVVRVVARIEGADADRFEIDFDPDSKGIEIETDCRGKNDRECEATLEIMVPHRYDIRIDSKGGSVRIENVTGRFDGSTYGGDIDLTGLSGEVKFTTFGGDVDVRESELDGRVRTLGGDISIRNVKGDLRGKSLGGDVTYDNAGSGGDDISVTTMGGDLDIEDGGKSVRARTFGGDVDVGRSEEVHVTTFGGDIEVDDAPRGAKARTMGGDITIRSAGDHAEAKTMGGDVSIEAIDGWVEASTMGGDVKVKMVGDPGSGDRHVELSSMGGDIELTVPEGLSMRFDIELGITKGAERSYRITSDFDMEIDDSGKWERSWWTKKKYIYGTGEVGGGEHLIKLKTTNGNITIRKG